MNLFDTQVKVCGITRPQDVGMCLQEDVRWIGLNLYAESPRSVDMSKAKQLLAQIPVGQRVYVDVAPSISTLHRAMDMGFDRYQIHFDYQDTNESQIEEWAEEVTPKLLWLAPRLPLHTTFPKNILPYAWNFMVDVYSADAFGGTGITANWRHFRALRDTHHEKGWILAGGLNAGNIREAHDESGSHFLNLNSGVESEPGIKDRDKLHAVMQQFD